MRTFTTGTCRNIVIWGTVARRPSHALSRNSYPTLLDKLEVCRGEETKDADRELFIGHCYPTEESIVAKIRKSREAYLAENPHKTLDILYVMSNAKPEWIKSLEERMHGDGWTLTLGSRDMKFATSEQKEVNMAVDMEIGRRAEMFVGNGVSALLI
jgi:hypothetical protein